VSLFDRIALRRASINRILVAVAILVVIACVVGAMVALTQFDSLRGARFVLLYVAPLSLTALWWIGERIENVDHVDYRARIWIDALVLALAATRFVTGSLPFSGHMLFLTYTGLTTERVAYRWLALLVAVETTIFKLILWHDPTTWAVGIFLGLTGSLAWRMSFFAARHARHK
jgi:hypothetical protein